MEEESAPTAGPGSPEAAVITAVMRWLHEKQPQGTVQPPSVSLVGRDPLHDLVTVLWRAALQRSLDRESMEALVWTAVRHGEARRRVAYTEDSLLEEYRLLRQLLTAHASARFRSLAAMNEAADSLQAGITLCVGGAIRGFHRDSFQAAGDWPQAVQRFLRAFHAPGERRPGLSA